MGHRNGGRIGAPNINQHVVTVRPSAAKAKKPTKKSAPAVKVEPVADAEKAEDSEWHTVTPTPTSAPSSSD